MAAKAHEQTTMEEGLLDIYFEFSPEQLGMTETELKVALASWNIQLGAESLHKLFQSYDEDEAGAIDFEEFRALMIEQLVLSAPK